MGDTGTNIRSVGQRNFSEEVTLKLRFEYLQGANYANIFGKSVP